MTIHEVEEPAAGMGRGGGVRFESLIENALDIIAVLDSAGTIRFGSPSFDRTLGYEPGHLTGRSAFDLIHPGDVGKARAAFERVLKNPSLSQSAEVNVLHGDGSWRVLEAVGKAFPDNPQAFVIVNARDITERKQSEEALEKLTHQTRLILDSTTEGICGVDAAGRITFINPAGAWVCGYETSELIGRSLHETVHHTKPDGTHYPKEECLHYRTLTSGIASSTVDEMFWRKDGTSVAVTTTTSPIVDQGTVVGAVIVFLDVTEQRRLQQQFLQAQKMEAVGQLAGGISHDFNNILSAIMGCGHLLLMKMDKDDPQKSYVEQILSSSQKAASLTRSLLAFSRKQLLEKQLVDVNEIVRKTGKLLPRLIGEDIDVEMSVAPEPLVIDADSVQVEQVLMNLATNARDAMPRGGRLAIRVESVLWGKEIAKTQGYGEPGVYACIAVSDTGGGMDESTRKRIFEPFFTTKEAGKGTGLGLSTAFGIVKQHDGYIAVVSEPGAGATFRVFLPLRKAAASLGAGGPGGEDMPKGNRETILLAEDDDDMRRIMRGMLEEYGYEVVEAVEGDDALRKLAEHGETVRLMILDVVMPKKSGREVYDMIERRGSKVKVLFTSGYPAEIVTKKGMLPKGLDFIRKPVRPEELMRRIHSMLNT